MPTGPMAKHFPFGIYAIPEISMVGETEPELARKRVPYKIGFARYREIARGQILGDDSGFFKRSAIARGGSCWACAPSAPAPRS